MSTFSKKVTSAVSGLAVVFSMVAPMAGVSAAYNAADAADKLATLGVIVDQSANKAAYRLADTTSRQELSKIIVKLGSLEVKEGESVFKDTNFASWAEKYAKALNEAGYAASNEYFNPTYNATKIEALKWVMDARGIATGTGSNWMSNRVQGAVDAGIATAFTDYNADVSRGQVFIWAANAVEAKDDTTIDESLCSIIGNCPTDDGETPTTPVVSGDNEVTLSPKTPASATVPGKISGLPVAAFDFTAGKSDITISSLVLTRKGLSDGDTLTSLAAFTDEGRASKAKNDSQENNTQATLTLSNGGVTVKAGETKTLTIVADVAASAGTVSDEFAIELESVVANANIDMDSNLVGNTMRVGGVDAAELVFKTDGSVSNVKAGESDAELFRLKVEGDNGSDVVIKSLTFRGEGSIDESDELENFKLHFDGDVVATTQYANGKYVTFDLGDGVTVREDKTEKFTVSADIIGGVDDTIKFEIDKSLDVTAIGTKYGYGASINVDAVDGSSSAEYFGELSVEAGAVTLAKMENTSDKLRFDKKDTVLGTIKLTNVSGADLDIQDFGIKLEKESSPKTFADTVENVELEINGTSYDLGNPLISSNIATYKTDIDVTIPQGVTEVKVKADIKKKVTNTSTTLKLSVSSNDLKIVEQEDEKQVTDISPSSLTYKTFDLIDAGATVAKQLLANTTVVRGSSDVVVAQFEVEAEEASAIEVDEVKATLVVAAVPGSTAPAAGALANKYVSEVALYKNSVSDANLLDKVSGSKISALSSGMGNLTFDGFKTKINADQKQTFVAVVNIVDGVDVENKTIKLNITSISAEDDENDDVNIANVSTTLNNNKTVTVSAAGTLVTPVLDLANADNEFDKLALAGESVIPVSFDVRANNEEVEVETVTFTVAGATNLQRTVKNATLLLDGQEVVTNSNSDITNTSIVFDDISNLVIPTNTAELALRLNTASIGKDLVGATQTNVTITEVAFSDAEGKDSGKPVTTSLTSGTVTSKTLDVVSAVVTPAVVSKFATDDQTAELRLVVEGGDNKTASGDSVQAELKSLKLDVSSITSAGNVTVFNSNGDVVATGSVSAPAAAVAAVAQESTLTIGGTFEAADKFTATVNGTPYTHTVVAGDTDNNGIATALAALINVDANVSATAAANVVTITAATAGTSFTVTPSVVDQGTMDITNVAVTTRANVAPVAAVASNQTVTLTLSTADAIGNDNEVYRIENTAKAVVRLAKDGVSYSINSVGTTTTKLENTLELGQYASSN